MRRVCALTIIGSIVFSNNVEKMWFLFLFASYKHACKQNMVWLNKNSKRMGKKHKTLAERIIYHKNREFIFSKLASILGFSHWKPDKVCIMYDYVRRKYPRQIDNFGAHEIHTSNRHNRHTSRIAGCTADEMRSSLNIYVSIVFLLFLLWFCFVFDWFYIWFSRFTPYIVPFTFEALENHHKLLPIHLQPNEWPSR